MPKKGLFIALAVVIIIAAVAYIAGSVNKNNDEASAEKTTTNQVKPAFTESVVNSDSTKFTSTRYDFSFVAGSEYGYIENSTSGSEVAAYTFSRINSNTSEEQNRDTPNGFNTSVDDRLGVVVYRNTQHISLDNLADFVSWQESVSPSAGIVGSAATHEFTSNTAIEAITAGGIDSEGRDLFFVSDSYIIDFSSSDVPKDEMYDIANSFVWE